MEREELIRNKDLLSYGTSDSPPPLLFEPGVLPASSLCPGVEPSAPPVELLDVGPGTGGSGAGAEGFSSPSLPKPAAYQAEESTLQLSEDEAKDALVQFAASKCCYSTAPAQHLVVQGLTALNTYRYQLQTFTESRSTLPASRPYQGEFVDSWQMGVPPAPWDIAVDPPPPFADCEVHLPVPHTSEVKGCPECSATGRAPCSSCRGSGKVRPRVLLGLLHCHSGAARWLL
ncbi:protein SSUH2 homolog [Pogoniulus pusillus]|uniref:protein SSUH2 homolog n=1 Tax=Pogoniulus pusillus TaxID=488313 RepID=UPI0030B987A8